MQICPSGAVNSSTPQKDRFPLCVDTSKVIVWWPLRRVGGGNRKEREEEEEGGIRGKGAVARDVHVKHGHLVFELQNLFDGGHWHQYLKCESMSWITGLNLVIREQENWPCASPRRHRSFISKGFTLPPSSTSGAARVSGLTHL
jgi:hypothetical protein